MTIRTVAVNDVTAVNFDIDMTNPYFYLSEKFVWVKNKSPSAMCGEAPAGIIDEIIPGADGVVEISAGECVMLNMPPTNIIYLSGDGDAEIYTSDVAVCPWEGGSSSGGGGIPADIGSITRAQIDRLFN